MSHQIILYDIPTKAPRKAWSPNPWKARAALNFKGLPYKTEWVEYPDLAPTLSGFDIPPNDGTAAVTDYSSPAARLPDGTYVMDSLKIAHALEALQPTPSLHLEGDSVSRAQEAATAIVRGLVPIVMPRVAAKLLSERSAAYFYETRAVRYGMPLPELEASERAGEAAWRAAEPGLELLEALLKENPAGPFVLGETPGFADLVICGFWWFIELLDEGGDLYGRIMRRDDGFARHYEACKPWMQKDD